MKLVVSFGLDFIIGISLLALFILSLVACGQSKEQRVEDARHWMAWAIAASGAEVDIAEQALPPRELGICSCTVGQCVIELDPIWGRGEATFVHELGHAMGLEHEPSGVMRMEVPDLDLPEAARQLRELCKERPCRKIKF